MLTNEISIASPGKKGALDSSYTEGAKYSPPSDFIWHVAVPLKENCIRPVAAQAFGISHPCQLAAAVAATPLPSPPVYAPTQGALNSWPGFSPARLSVPSSDSATIHRPDGLPLASRSSDKVLLTGGVGMQK